MMQIFDNAIANGYPIAWGSDVSEQGFRMGVRKGFCVLPATEVSATMGSDMAHWTGMKAADIQNEAAKHPTPSAGSLRKNASSPTTTARLPTTTAC